jgi:hypothetical protein
MAGNTIGEAFVSIRPDMAGFETQLLRAYQRRLRGLPCVTGVRL